jgi:hypothetical protein
MWFQTTKKNNGPNICGKANTRKFYVHDIDLYLLFIGFKKAFDSINQKKLLESLVSFGIPKKIE